MVRQTQHMFMIGCHMVSGSSRGYQSAKKGEVAHSNAIEKMLGPSGIVALTKVMGLILLTIGVEIFLGGMDTLLDAYILTIPGLMSGSSS